MSVEGDMVKKWRAMMVDPSNSCLFIPEFWACGNAYPDSE